MNPKSFLQSFNAALDTLVQREFDCTNAESLLPSGRLLSIPDRLQVVRNFDLERPEFSRKVEFSAAATFDVVAEVRRIDQAMDRLHRDLLECEPTREKLIAMGTDSLYAMNPNSPHFDSQDQIRADLTSTDDARIVRALSRLDLKSDALAQLIRDELADLTEAQVVTRQVQFAQSLATYQQAKSNLVGAWFSVSILFSLHYAGGVPARDLLIVGFSGLAKAIEKFDSQGRLAFGSYAPWWVRQALTRSNLDLRGWTLRDAQLLSEMRKLIGKSEWDRWASAPNPADIVELGIGEQEAIDVIERGRDKSIHPIHLRGRHLTPECAGAQCESIQLSENVTTETNPIWWM